MKFFTGKDFAVLVLLLFAPLVFFSFAKTFNFIGGAAIYADSVRPEVLQLVSSHPLTRLAAAGSQLCFLIDDPAGSVSFSVLKNDRDDFNVSESAGKYCSGAENEDFIFEFLSYDSFKKEVRENSCDSFKGGWKGDDYYFLISKFVLKGGDIVCDDSFRDKYCAAVKYCYTPSEISAYRLDCCADYSLSDEESAVFDELSAEGVKKGSAVDMSDKPVSEKPGFDFVTWIVFPLLIVVLVVVIVLLKGGVFVKKPVVNPKFQQLQGYVYNTLRLGYPPQQVYFHLLEQGWPRDVVDSVFQNIYK